MMDDSRIFVANLSKGMLGEDKSNLLGALLVSQFQVAALSRADLGRDHRRPFSLFIDEFHNFCSESFSSILSEARKYGLNVTLAHQFLSQVPEETQDAVFGNVGNLFAFQLGSIDAERIAKEMIEQVAPSQLTGLNKFEAIVRSVTNGEAETPYLLKTVPPIHLKAQSPEKLIRRSRERFTCSRRLVESKLTGWIGKPLKERTARRVRR